MWLFHNTVSTVLLVACGSIFVHEVGGLWKEAPPKSFCIPLQYLYRQTKEEGLPAGTTNTWLRFIPGMQVTWIKGVKTHSVWVIQNQAEECMENGGNGKYEKMRGQYTTQRWTINLFLNKVTILFPEWDLPLYSGCHRWQKIWMKQLTICVPFGKYGLSTSGTLMPVSVW